MKTYHNFIGIDIGKFNFAVAVYNNKETREFENNPEGIAKFFECYNLVNTGLKLIQIFYIRRLKIDTAL